MFRTVYVYEMKDSHQYLGDGMLLKKSVFTAE